LVLENRYYSSGEKKKKKETAGAKAKKGPVSEKTEERKKKFPFADARRIKGTGKNGQPGEGDC